MHREEITETIKKFVPPAKILVADSAGFSSNAPGEPQSAYGASRSIHTILIVAGLGVVYFVAAKLGLKLAFVYPSASSVWPGTGIALAAFVLLGFRAWPAIFLGALLANVTTAGSVASRLATHSKA